MIIEERVRPGESAHPPAHNVYCTAGKNAKRWRRRRVPRKWTDGRVLENAAQRWPEQRITRPPIRRAIYDWMNQRDDRKARVGGGVSDWGAATISVPAQDFTGKAQAAQHLEGGGERHPSRRHMENVSAAGKVENVRSFKEACKRLAVLAVADETEAGRGRNRTGDAARTTATASQRDVYHLAFFIGGTASSGLCAAHEEAFLDDLTVPDCVKPNFI